MADFVISTFKKYSKLWDPQVLEEPFRMDCLLAPPGSLLAPHPYKSYFIPLLPVSLHSVTTHNNLAALMPNLDPEHNLKGFLGQSTSADSGGVANLLERTFELLWKQNGSGTSLQSLNSASTTTCEETTVPAELTRYRGLERVRRR